MKFTVNRAVVQPVKSPVESITLVVNPQELAILRQSVGCSSTSLRANTTNADLAKLLGNQSSEMHVFNMLVRAIQEILS
jgi:hypothetical protein